jgi:hypothetical protein
MVAVGSGMGVLVGATVGRGVRVSVGARVAVDGEVAVGGADVRVGGMVAGMVVGLVVDVDTATVAVEVAAGAPNGK